MCGIIGMMGALAQQRERHEPAMAALAHRGPDSSGTWCANDGFVWFGHRRLAIIDLSPGGHQPKTSRSGRSTITYNGELYNYRELRNALHSEGVATTTQSDTEILVEACEHWGVEQTLQRAVGMFAFVIYDQHERRLIMARDRFGEKPLYYVANERDLAFASELKGLVALGLDLGGVQASDVTNYLAFGYVTAPRTIYRNVDQLEAGTWAAVSIDRAGRLSSLKVHRYWDPIVEAADACAHRFQGSYEDAVREVGATIDAAVASRCISDVPIGSLLSGGVDSSLVTAAMVRASNGPVRTFTIGFEEAHADESSYARRVAAHLGTNHVELRVTASDSLALVGTMATMFDEPFADASQLPTAVVARLARGHVTVALAGDGGDELFGGYSRFAQADKVRSFLVAPAAVRNAAGGAIGMAASLAERGAHLGGTRASAVQRMAQRSRRLRDFLEPDDFSSLYWGMVRQWPGAMPNSVRSILSDDRFTPIERMMLFETTSYLTNDLLTKTDRTAMAVSLEGRLPLLDPTLYRLAWSLPIEWKIQGKEKKRVLRDALARDIPRELYERPKMGFGVPVGEWLRGPLRDWAEDLLIPSRLAAIPGVDVPMVRQTWAEHLTGRRNWQGRMWSVLMLSSWFDRWSTVVEPGAA